MVESGICMGSKSNMQYELFGGFFFQNQLQFSATANHLLDNVLNMTSILDLFVFCGNLKKLN